ncbi:beta strand repeat-containing protein [Azospirillum thiophilum]|uniref:beta strand repeat-containing protein n=1 Tax=Azospirillum thiophilum TaxID=528244 RepID=UPI000B1BDC37|nr:hypothetical protein [Azospirillum thiophilum]
MRYSRKLFLCLLASTALTGGSVCAEILTSGTTSPTFGTESNSTVAGSVGVGIGGTGTLTVNRGSTLTTTGAGNGVILGTGSSSASGTALVSGGGRIDSLFFGVGLDGNGTLQVSGTGSRIVATTANGLQLSPSQLDGGGIQVGRNSGSVGQFNVLNGATATVEGGAQGSTALGSYMNIARNQGSRGSVLVEGTGSTLTFTQARLPNFAAGEYEPSVSIGRGGNGAMILRNGGTVALTGGVGPASLSVARDAGALGTLEVTGSGSQLLMSGTGTSNNPVAISIGRGGSGSATVSQGGLLSVDAGSGVANVSVGRDAGAVGTLTVSGSGSRMTVNGSGSGVDTTWMSVGRYGTGRLVVEDGATLTVNNGDGIYGGLVFSGSRTISASEAGNAFATIQGRGTTVNVQGSSAVFSVGESGRADVTVTDNATVNTLDLSIGSNSGAAGTLMVSGGGSVRLSGTDSNGGLGAAALVGDAGTGILTVSGGGSLVVDAAASGSRNGVFVGARSGGIGTLTVTGSGSLVDAGSLLGVGIGQDGRNGGAATVTVSDGGELRAGTVLLGSATGTASTSKILSVLNGGKVTAGEVQVNPGGRLVGTGTVAGRVTLNGGVLSTGSSIGTMTIGNGLTVNSGTVLVKVNGAAAGQYDIYAVNGAATFNGGTVTMQFADNLQPADGDRYHFLTTTQGAEGQAAVVAQANRSGVAVELVPTAQPGSFDLVVTGGGTAAAATAEAVSNTAQEQGRATVRSVVTSVSTRIRDTFTARRGDTKSGSPQQVGLAAGDTPGQGAAVWADGGFSRLRNENSSDGFSGYTRNLLFGADYSVADGFVVGGAIGWERSTLSLRLNDGKRTGTGITAVGYAGYQFTDWLNADVQAGATRLTNTLKQYRAGTADEGRFASTRLFAAANLNATWQMGDVGLAALSGVSVSRETFASYELSGGSRVSPDSVYLGQVRAGGEASYRFDQVTPYVSAVYEVDVRNSSGGDRSGAILGGGLRSTPMDNLTVGLFGSAQVLRKDDKAYTVSANVRYAF